METLIACPECGSHCHKKGTKLWDDLALAICPVHGYGHICQCKFCMGKGTVKATFRNDLGW